MSQRDKAGASFRYKLSIQLSQFAILGPLRFIHWHAFLFDAWIRCVKNKRHYHVLSRKELLKTRKSDTVFIFGSGYSLNSLAPEEWQHFEKSDTLGLTGFANQRWIRTDYHLFRAGPEYNVGTFKWRNFATEYVNTLNSNPHFNDTIFIMQGDYLGQFCNAIIGYRLLKKRSRIFLYATERASMFPTSSLRWGLSHTSSTLCDVVNFAYCMGWKKIILVGVDLYDSRYFWLKPDETLDIDYETGLLKPSRISCRQIPYDQPHNTVRNRIIETMGRWREMFLKEGVEMQVYNPKSLLTQVMPVYRMPGK